MSVRDRLGSAAWASVGPRMHGAYSSQQTFTIHVNTVAMIEAACDPADFSRKNQPTPPGRTVAASISNWRLLLTRRALRATTTESA